MTVGATNMEKINIGFLGYGTRALDALMADERFDVKYFVAPLTRVDEYVYKARKDYPDIPFFYVRNNNELSALFDKLNDADVFLMNACPIILNEEVIGKKEIYNIHPGDLNYNRGHQPHQWTVLLGEKESKIVCHTVTPGIDEGKLIGFVKKEIPSDYDALQVLDLLEDQVPLLLDALYKHITEGTPPIADLSGGQYRHVLEHEDYRIYPEKIAEDGFYEDMSRKIRARVMNHGAYFIHAGNRIYVDKILYEEEGANEPKVSVYKSVAFIEGKGKRYVLRLNHKEAKGEDE